MKDFIAAKIFGVAWVLVGLGLISIDIGIYALPIHIPLNAFNIGDIGAIGYGLFLITCGVRLIFVRLQNPYRPAIWLPALPVALMLMYSVISGL